MTKNEALDMFKKDLWPGIKSAHGYSDADKVAIREAWNDFTDSLCKGRNITMKQYESWTNPF